MARTQRAPNTRAREIDFSNVGKAGRRTGLTLPQQKVDEHGLEEVSQLFSSPKKPSPLKQMHTAEDLAREGEDSTAMTGIDSSGITPAQALSARRTARASLPRSASPRKTGITGSARRSTGGFRANRQDLEIDQEDEEEDADDELPVSSPSRANRSARRQSGGARDASPLRDITSRNQPTPPTRSSATKRGNGYSVMTSIENEYQGSDLDDDEQQPFVEDAPVEIDDYNPEPEAHEEDIEGDMASVEPMPQIDDEEADETFTNTRTTANSRKKRKSDSEPARQPAKKRKRLTAKGTKSSRRAKTRGGTEDIEADGDEEAMPPPRGRGRPPKNDNTKMTKQQEKELDEVVERVKARPNPPRSLYVLRKETPSDPNARLTRSGRMTVKPLAYWRNERCVWGGSPNTELKEGTRFPMNSIREIIRTDDHNTPIKRSKAKNKGKGKKKAKSTEPEDSSSDEEAAHVEPWEIGSGTIRGTVSEWDSYEGLPLNVEQEIEIAHSSQAIQTYVPQPKNGQEPAQFRYSKLFSNNFMSVGLVDLPPGGIKKPKNSQKMQMTFYVLKGRVTVTVGPVLGEQTTFGIGKGGFWQVPRGNQYSIENEHGTEARLVFCQGCMVSPEEEE